MGGRNFISLGHPFGVYSITPNAATNAGSNLWSSKPKPQHQQPVSSHHHFKSEAIMLDNRALDNLSPTARSVFCLNFITINHPHIVFWAEEFSVDTQPYIKLSAKLQSYLIGELKSVSNLHRYYEDFFNWKESLTDHDCLAQRIVNLCFSTICAAVDTLADPECDDVNLVISESQQIIEEMAELGCNTDDIQQQVIEFINFNKQLLDNIKQKPVARDCLIQLSEDSSTLFGL